MELFSDYGSKASLSDPCVLTYAQFQVLIGNLKETGQFASPKMRNSMDLFRKYDVDNSGTIDKFEVLPHPQGLKPWPFPCVVKRPAPV